MSAKCPRCGEEMTGGICDNCGFPLTKMMKKNCKRNRQNSDENMIATKEKNEYARRK